jgi:hypothetical protein
MRSIAADGTLGEPRTLNATTRQLANVPGSSATVTSVSGPTLRVDGDRIDATWGEWTDAAIAGLQSFDAAGQPLAPSIGLWVYNFPGDATSVVTGAQMHAAYYRQGLGSVSDFQAVVGSGPLGDPAAWTQTPLEITQPAGDIWRRSPQLIATSSGRVFVDTAKSDSEGYRIEIVRLDASNAITDTAFIDLDRSIQFVSEVRAIGANDSIYLVWADSTDSGTYGASLHVTRIDSSGARREAAAPLRVDAYLSGLGPILGAPIREDGGLSVAYLWQDTVQDTWHAGWQFFCLGE